MITFGSVFNADFLKAVLKLQEDIKALGNGTLHGFDKVCFAPLRRVGDKETSTNQCVVQSIWGYYKDSIEDFDENGTDPSGYETNYLDKFLKCTA